MPDVLSLQHEREQPECLVKSLSRRRRIARGSGRAEVDVSNMLASFANMRSKVRDLSKLMKMSGANGARSCCTLVPDHACLIVADTHIG